MKEIFYDWIRNIVFYQLLSSIILNIIPGDKYQKYVRFFLGMLFLLISIRPVLEILQLTDDMDVSYVQQMLERDLEENKVEFDVEEAGRENEEVE